jgi:DNA-directed RNA polymerase specialized sigma24 family protein
MDRDVASFQEIYERYAADVFRFSLWLCGNADDITAESFARFWTSESEIRTETVKAYLFAIARNHFLHEKRKTDRVTRLTDAVAHGDPKLVLRVVFPNPAVLRQERDGDRSHPQDTKNGVPLALECGTHRGPPRYRV